MSVASVACEGKLWLVSPSGQRPGGSGVGQAHREQAAQIQRGAAVMEPVIVLRDTAVADFAVASGQPRDRTFHHRPMSTVLVEPQRILCSTPSLSLQRVVRSELQLLAVDR